ncbi:MAG TPA: FAD-binding protein [Thermoanaerobaculia bacterium]|nr:FAD-binding protein [Thermoanaerobaculia bacterium]
MSKILLPRGRVSRGRFWLASALLAVAFAILFAGFEALFGRQATLILYPPLLWLAFVLAAKRYHDFDRSPVRLLLLVIPIIGPIVVGFDLLFHKGTAGSNRYGADPKTEGIDYQGVPLPLLGNDGRAIVNDVTALNPVRVAAIVVPATIDEVTEAIRRSTGPVSVGGGHFSMGGQTASENSLHLDMRRLNQILQFSPTEKTIRVQAGVRWCDLQRFLDPHGLAVKIMQTYANFTVGGALSVNCHGRYVGLGPLVLSVRSITLVLADGTLVEASPSHNADLFYGSIGGYNALGVIVEAELELADNERVERIAKKLPVAKYYEHFRQTVRGSKEAVFHNADLYPPSYQRARSVTWVETQKAATNQHRLQTPGQLHLIEKYFMWAISETPLGKWRREYLVDRLLYLRRPVHWRNFEAGYDVAELEPWSRKATTYVLQEYFVPVARFDEFVPKMAEILQRHNVNVINISVRHAYADPGTYLAWAREEVFAFVLYYKQRVRENAKTRVGVWTRELIDAALSCGGTYYLPYQPHATHEQFHAAYPRAKELFALKRKYDPQFRFRNVLWDKYYSGGQAILPVLSESEFQSIFSNVASFDAFYLFLQNVYHIYPEDRFQTLIKEACSNGRTDEEIYRYIQQRLPDIKPALADVSYALPALKKQKEEMARQTLDILGDRKKIHGYVEIGSTGRYVSELQDHVEIEEPVYVIHDAAPTNSPVDIAERGGLAKIGTFLPLDDYAPLSGEIADQSIDVVTCFIGLHHAPPAKLDAFVRSIHRVLRSGGLFIVRDHDVQTPQMDAFVSLAHTVFNAGLGIPWDVNERELRHFAPISHWAQYLGDRGFADTGARILQAHDPSANTLMAFQR